MTYEHGNTWIDTLPASVRIGAFTYRVELMDVGYERERGVFGECVNNDQVIRLGPTQTAEKARDTLLHEITHALLWVYGIQLDTVKEWVEHLCSQLPMALFLLKRDNPGVWRWIFDNVPPRVLGNGTGPDRLLPQQVPSDTD